MFYLMQLALQDQQEKLADITKHLIMELDKVHKDNVENLTKFLNEPQTLMLKLQQGTY